MKALAIKVLSIGILSTFLILGFNGLAHSGGPSIDQLGYIGCNADGNNSAVTATLVNRGLRIFDAVCEADPHDWYLLPLTGDVTWGGRLFCQTDGPGLRVALYVDAGSGLQLVKEESPAEFQVEDKVYYKLEWDILALASGMGLSAGPPGAYYIRITYYTYYPGVHPYMFYANLEPHGFKSPTNNSFDTAMQLPPGMTSYGHLDASSPSNWFTFTIGPGQSGTGVIFGENIYLYLSGGKGPYQDSQVALKVLNSNLNVLGETIISNSAVGSLDSAGMSPLPPGSYFIELSRPPGNDSPSWELFYMIFNHALAPDTGDWGPDLNNDNPTAVQLVEGVPLAAAVYNPRDLLDVFTFTTQGYFLGDIIIEPTPELKFFLGNLRNGNGLYLDAHFLPNIGVTSRFTPQDKGVFYFETRDLGKMTGPVQFTMTYYEHGEPMTQPVGHDTTATAEELPPGTATPYHVSGEGALIDFQPGIQDKFVFRVEVPSGDMLAGYYELKGSRTDYQVQLGKNAGGNIQWSPAMYPDSNGKLYIDLSYDFLVDAGTYYVKVKMLPSSPGRMRVFLDNHSRIAVCEPDENNSAEEALNLQAIKKGNNYFRFGDVCDYDHADWYYFTTEDYDPSDGPKQFIRLKGAVAGMSVHVVHPDSLGSMAVSEVEEDGGVAVLDLDGVPGLSPDKKFYVMVAYTDVDIVQVYDLELCPDIKFFVLPGKMLEIKPKLKIQPGVFLKIDED